MMELEDMLNIFVNFLSKSRRGILDICRQTFTSKPDKHRDAFLYVSPIWIISKK